MGRSNLPFLIDSLIQAGRSPQTAVACVQEATLENQQSVCGQFENIVERVQQSELVSPMITVIGDVVQFCQPNRFPDLSNPNIRPQLAYVEAQTGINLQISELQQ